MPIELKIPPIGESISEVEIGDWSKNEGDPVQKDETVVVLESEKARITEQLRTVTANVVTLEKTIGLAEIEIAKLKAAAATAAQRAVDENARIARRN